MRLDRLSIVIPTLGRSEALADVLVGLERQRPPLQGVEIVVVVDAQGSTEDVRRLTASQKASGLAIQEAQDAGASGARNTGWRAARPLT